MADLGACGVGEHRHPLAVAGCESRIGVDIELLEVHAERAQGARHLLAQVAVAASVEPQRQGVA